MWSVPSAIVRGMVPLGRCRDVAALGGGGERRGNTPRAVGELALEAVALAGEAAAVAGGQVIFTGDACAAAGRAGAAARVTISARNRR